jgi:DNA modification methylase
MANNPPSGLQFYFKLFNNLKDESEPDLAQKELTSLFGEVAEVQNFVDEFVSHQLPAAVMRVHETRAYSRLQDAITYELPYGRIQGFKGRGTANILPKLAKRLAYTRETYVVVPEGENEPDTSGLKPNVNLFVYQGEHSHVIRVISNQYFLEKSEYISKLSRNKDEIDANLATLLTFTADQSQRIPATETMAVGRRLEDWFAIREEPSLYTTHYMHPYKGKFHPKMVRALINFTFPHDDGLVLDNFSGSGTTLVEAQWLGLRSIGIDINPLSALMSQVKVQCQEINDEKLKKAIDEFLASLKVESTRGMVEMSGQQTLSGRTQDISRYNGIIATLPARVRKAISEEQLFKIMLAKDLLRLIYGEINGDAIHEFLLLGLGGAISDVSRRTTQDFNEVLKGRLYHLWGRVYLSRLLRDEFGMKFASGECCVGDTRDLSNLNTLGGKKRGLQDNSVDCIVNSPPYSTALDYIKNDLPQLSILQMTHDMDVLAKSLIGNPNLRVYDKKLQTAIANGTEPFSSMPAVGKQMLRRMAEAGRAEGAARVLKFWVDVRETLREMHRVLKPNAKAAVVIGDNNVQLIPDSKLFEQVPNVQTVQDLGQEVGLSTTEVIQRQIEKTMTGMIRSEAIIIFEKHAAMK